MHSLDVGRDENVCHVMGVCSPNELGSQIFLLEEVIFLLQVSNFFENNPNLTCNTGTCFSLLSEMVEHGSINFFKLAKFDRARMK